MSFFSKIFRNQVSLKYFFSVLLASGSVFLMLLFAMLVEKYSSYGTEVTIGQKFTINKAGLYVLYVNNKNFKHSDKIELLSESGGGMISGSPYHSLISVDVRGEDYEPASCFCITNPAQYTFLCDGQLGSLYLEMDHGLASQLRVVTMLSAQ